MAREVYACRACGREVEPERDGRTVLVRNRQVLLTCGHTAHPAAMRIRLEPADAEITPEAEAAMYERLERGRDDASDS